MIRFATIQARTCDEFNSAAEKFSHNPTSSNFLVLKMWMIAHQGVHSLRNASDTAKWPLRSQIQDQPEDLWPEIIAVAVYGKPLAELLRES